MEVAGLAVGVIGLVGLYSCCADLAQTIKSYRKFHDRVKKIKKEYERYQDMLDGWAESVGFKDIDPEKHHHESLDNEKTRRAVKSTLETTQSVLQSINQIFDKLRKKDENSRLEKVKYALGQEAKLRNLIGDLHKLVSVLYTIIPSERSSTSLEMKFETISNIDATLFQVEQKQENLLDYFSRGKEIEIKKWLGACSPDQALRDRLDIRAQKTCDWSLRDARIQAWLTLDILDSRTRLLWIHGPAGHGKSVLCARLIEQLKSSVPNRVAFYFCKWQSDETRHLLGVLRSWITQVAKQVPGTIEIVADYFEGHEERVAISSELWDIFARINRRTQRCIYVVDGLDECVEDESLDKEAFIQKLLASLHLTRSRLLIVSRHNPQLESLMDGEGRSSSSNVVSVRSINREDLQDDIRVYVTAEVSRKLRLEHKQVIRDEVVKALVEKSGGMFLWVNLVMPQLARRENSKQQLLRAIDETPKDLDKAYERDLHFIEQLDSWSQDRALRVLRWVSFAMRPLTVGELVEALVVAESDTTKFPEDEMPDVIDKEYVQKYLVGLCGTLVEVRESNLPVRDWLIHPIHLSVKQYLTGEIKTSPFDQGKKKPFSNQLAQHFILADTCIRYICHDDFDLASLNAEFILSLAEQRPFLRYASYGGLLHRNLCSKDDKQNLADKVFRAFDPAHSNWRCFSIRDSDAIQQLQRFTHKTKFDNQELQHPDNPFYFASLAGQSDVAEWLLEQSQFDLSNLNAKGSDGWTTLHYVAKWGLEDIARMICKTCPNLDATNSLGFTPLHLAAQNGHLGIFNLLVEQGATLHTKSMDGGTPRSLACAAAQGGNPSILRRIQDLGIDFTNERFIHAHDPAAFHLEPLHATIYYANYDAMAWLLENGTSVSPADGKTAQNRGRFALWESNARRNVDMARMLLHHGAQHSGYCHPIDKITQLSRAVQTRDLAMVDIMCNCGANVNETNWDEHNSTPMVKAVGANFPEITERLLRTGKVDLTLGDRWGHTPLLQAAAHGRLAAVNLLLAVPGIDTRASNLECPSRTMRGGWADERRSPLGWAKHGKHWAVVKAIEEHRAKYQR